MKADRAGIFKLGVTGGIASGKTTVCRLLGRRGAAVIDADEVGRKLLRGEILRRVVESLGDSFILPDGRPDRRRLGRLVFSQPETFERFNSIIHPPLLDTLGREIEKVSSRQKVVVLDAALIFEWGINSWFDKIVVVVAPDETRIRRLVEQTGLSLAEARGRLERQLSQEEKISRADCVIVNDGSLDDLQKRVAGYWLELGFGGENIRRPD